MTKKDLSNVLKDRCELPSRTMSESIIDNFIEIIKEVVQKGDDVTIRGFGTFKALKKKDRNGINPKTKEKMIINGCTTIKLKPSKEFRW